MAGRGGLLMSSLPNLQNLIKRDPASYTDEFLIQLAHYNALRNLIEQGVSTSASGAGNAAASSSSGKASADEERFRDLVGFVAQTAACYPKHTADLPSHFTNLLLKSHANLSTDTRKTLIHSLVLLRNRGVITGADLLKTLFPLLTTTTSSSIRGFILKTILSDVKSANAKTKNHQFNRLVQGLLYDMVERSSTTSEGASVADYSGTGTKKSTKEGAAAGKEAMWAVKLAAELWKKGIWRDARTANLIGAACFHSNTKVQSAAMHFFLNTSGSGDGDSDSDSDGDNPQTAMNNIRQVKHQLQINKKKRASERAAKRSIKQANAKRKAAELKEPDGAFDNSALNLLHDPQQFGEKLYDLLVKNDKKFTLEHKVLIMQLFSRLMGLYKIFVLPFYTYIVKYLSPHQLSITTILVALASSVHDLVPPELIEPLCRKLADEFCHSAVSSQVVAAGLNAIREICRRQPLGMQKDLLADLAAYDKSKDKGVMMAARSLVQLYREVDPDLLPRTMRGKVASMKQKSDEMTKLEYGKTNQGQSTIEGLGLLQQYLEEKQAGKDAEKADGEDAKAEGSGSDASNEENDGWEVDSSASEDESEEDGWIAVSSDEEGGDYFDDSEDEDARVERRTRKRQKTSEVPEEEVLDADKLEVTKEEMNELDKDKENKDALLSLATTRILTPADFAKLNELRTEAAEAEVKAGGGGAAKRKLALLKAAKKALKAKGVSAEDGGVLNEADIIGTSKKSKADYEERMASIAKGREGREKFGSNKGKKKKAAPSSSTNKEKRKNTKAFAMVAHSRSVQGKGRASLRAKQKRLQGYSKSQKKNARQAARL